MVNRQCKAPGCTKKTRRADGFCSIHASAPQQRTGATRKFYDKHKRNPNAKKFYNSKAWKVARAECLRNSPICKECRKRFAEHVHHAPVPLDECTPEQAVDQKNLNALCQPCHSEIEAAIERGKANSGHQKLASEASERFVSGTLHPVEDDEFYYDAKAAERPIRFIEKFCQHYEGEHKGKPFKLLEWQKEIVRTLFGWKERKTGLRRFRKLFLISAKGTGKTPFIAGIGLYMLLADGEPAAHVISMASTSDQAKLTFDAGSNYVQLNEILSDLDGLDAQERVIKAPEKSKWTMISGKPTGRSGPRPSCVIADEMHEWSNATAKAFDLVCANLFKRRQPLLLQATNAGPNRQCYAYQVYQYARKVLSGEIIDKQLLPVIFEADQKMDWRIEAAAKAANPSIGQFVKWDNVRENQKEGEATYRRLFLSQWVSGGEKFINITDWDNCVGYKDDAELRDAALYVGVDGSLVDDLFAVVYLYITRNYAYVRSSFWLPKKTAHDYRIKNGFPYAEWAEQGDINLIDEDTMSEEVLERIAAEIIATHNFHPVQMVCYDRSYTSACTAALQRAGITLTPVGQAWGVANGTADMQRRIIEKTLIVEPNDVLRFCLENTEVKRDDRGNIWPVKPNAKGGYAGTRPAKIDGITALVTGLTRAREHDFPNDREWQGTIERLSHANPK